LSRLLTEILQNDADAVSSVEEMAKAQARRCDAIKKGQTAKALPFILDEAPYVSGLCPRRSGKSFAAASKAVYVGETKPGSRILVISLTLKSTKENYWSGAPSGIFRMDKLFDLGLKFHHTDLVWWHQNGSRGRLAGAETKADIEYLRGAAAEADLVIIDECKSFAPALLHQLIQDVLEPGMMTRNGQIVLIGTPGLIPVGPFYEATYEDAYKEDENKARQPTCVLYTGPVAHQEERLACTEEAAGSSPAGSTEEAAHEPWSLHHWTVKDNTAAPGQWARALRIKRKAGWDDMHPTWRREFLGQWVMDVDGLVYAFAQLRASGKVTWDPERSPNNPTGLPQQDGPWHLILGIDFGYEDDFALVLAAYSEQLCELRHVYDFKTPHLIVEQMVGAILEVIDRFGMPEAMVGDAGGLGKVLVETLNQTYALPVIKAEKHEKFDHIELLNSDFHSGRVKILDDSDLAYELSALQWDLKTATKTQLVRAGKLREDKECPNHLCDALLYLWRYSFHYWAAKFGDEPEWGTVAYYEQQEQLAEERASARYTGEGYTTDKLAKNRGGLLTRESASVKSWISTRMN
jgi:hypothetical protein